MKSEPQRGKIMLDANNAYFTLRAAIYEQADQLRRLSVRASDPRAKVIKSLERLAISLKGRFERASVIIDPKECARKIVEREIRIVGDDTISKCRYYHGESDNPTPENDNTNRGRFWEYEKIWCETYKSETSYNIDNVTEYICYGLMMFGGGDTPMTLKALLFNRYSHWFGSNASGFKKFYYDSYQNNKY